MLQKYLDKFYSNCYKVFKANLTIMSCRVNFVFYSFWLDKREIITFDFLECNLIKYS